MHSPTRLRGIADQGSNECVRSDVPVTLPPGAVRHVAQSDETHPESLQLRSRAVQLLQAEQPIPFRPCLPPSPRREPERPPQSVGRILVLPTGRLGALSRRDERGRRKQLGIFTAESEAQRAITGGQT